jgi:hypothetical protein
VGAGGEGEGSFREPRTSSGPTQKHCSSECRVVCGVATGSCPHCAASVKLKRQYRSAFLAIV